MRAGIRGLMVGFLYSAFRVMLAMRLYELEHGLNLETIEAEYVKAKQKIVADIEKP
jgi:hypothetical protein